MAQLPKVRASLRRSTTEWSLPTTAVSVTSVTSTALSAIDPSTLLSQRVAGGTTPAAVPHNATPDANETLGDVDDADVDVDGDEETDADVVESLKPLDLPGQLELLRGKLVRRNKLLEVIRRAYFQDVIVIKEELRSRQQQLNQHALLAATNTSGNGSNGSSATSSSHSLNVSTLSPSAASGSSSSLLSHAHANSHATARTRSVIQAGALLSPPLHFVTASDDRLAAVPSVDLRDVLPLFAPAETVLQVHPCESCGGHLELVHGESKELQLARQEMQRAVKSEQQMKSVVHRLRSEAHEFKDINDALEQRVKSLIKENAYSLDQLQAARKLERDQKTMLANLRSKLQLALQTQEEAAHLALECTELREQLVHSNHDRDIFSASNNHLKEELAEVTRALHQVKVEKAQSESDYGTTAFQLQEERKKTTTLENELKRATEELTHAQTSAHDSQSSLSALKNELATALQRAEQTRRELEDQLLEEERAREEMQEQNLEFRKVNKRLQKEIKRLHDDPLGFGTSHMGGDRANENSGRVAGAVLDGGLGSTSQGTNSTQGGRGDPKTAIRARIESLILLAEHSQMRENDALAAWATLRDKATEAAKVPLRRKLSRMPSTTVITRFASPAEPPSSDIVVSERNCADADSNGDSATASNAEKIGSPEADVVASKESRAEEQNHKEMATQPPEMDMASFEAYHQDLHNIMLEVEEAKDRNQKQQKVIAGLERKNQTLTDRLEESKLTIEALTGSVHALKMRLNQDNAGVAEHFENMVRQIEEGKRDQQYESERAVILSHFLKTISSEVYTQSGNPLLLTEFDLERPVLDDSSEKDSMMSPELLQKKRELRRKVLMDKAMKKFSQLCYSRAEIIALELKKMSDNLERLRNELDQAEIKIDSEHLLVRTLEAEVGKLRLTVDVGKSNLTRTEHALKTTTAELKECTETNATQLAELRTLTEANATLREDERRVTVMLFDKTKAWEREINVNERCMQKISKMENLIRVVTADRDALEIKIQKIDDLAKWRLETNCSVGISVKPEVTESDMQTDQWRPQGLILRQRNDPQRTPQRYLGKASVTIACPDLNKLQPPRLFASKNQEAGMHTSLSDDSMAWGNAESHPGSSAAPVDPMRDMLELTLFPPAKAGGRQIKTSHASSRPRALSKLYLSSDGVSKKYATTASDELEHHIRPSTTQ